MQNFRALGAPPPDPVLPAAGGFAPKPPASGDFTLRTPLASGGWGLRPQPPKTAPHRKILATRLATLDTKSINAPH